MGTKNELPVGKFLVVDDTMLQREIVAAQLAAHGIKKENILFAYDGMHALEVLRSHKVDTVISDYSMPRMDGIELLLKLRENSVTRGTPFVLMSSDLGVELQEIARINGAVFLPKQPGAHKLMGAVQLAGMQK